MTARPFGEWTPVSEAQPDTGLTVLFVAKYRWGTFVQLGYFDAFQWVTLYDFEEGESRPGHVTHWMPLPDVPEV